MINLDKIKKDATSVCKYEIRSHLYRTVIENVEVKANSYGLINVVTYRGLHRLRCCEVVTTYVDDDTTFQCEYATSVTTFNDVPFGSEVQLSLLLVVEETTDDDGDVSFKFKATRPKHLIVTCVSDGETYRPYIKNLPRVDLHSEVDVFEQYLELGYDYDRMCDMQQEQLSKAEYRRLINIEKDKEIKDKVEQQKTID